jgi:hypothetical protein
VSALAGPLGCTDGCAATLPDVPSRYSDLSRFELATIVEPTTGGEQKSRVEERPVRAAREAGEVTLVLDGDEVGRLAAVLREAAIGMSRAEFFIRLGCSRPNVEALVHALESMAAGQSTGFDIELAAGVERDENPPWPRS